MMGEQPKKAKKDRPAWLKGAESPRGAGPSAAPRREAGRAAPAEGTAAGAGVATRTRSGSAAGPLAEDGTGPLGRERAGEPAGNLAREYLGRVDRGEGSQNLRDKAGASGESRLEGAWEWVTKNRAVVMAAGAILILAVGLRACAGGDAPRQQAQAPVPEPSGRAAPGEVRDTGLAFSGLKQRDGVASLDAGELHWDGEVTAGEQGETVTLQGPTAFQLERGFRLPKSAVESGTFAVAQDDGPVIHVDTHTFRAGETEVTLGSLFAIEDDVLEDHGFYVDERANGSEEVVRTYFDPDGGPSYAVSFAAPEGTPVPLLVGWRGPGAGPGSEGPTGG